MSLSKNVKKIEKLIYLYPIILIILTFLVFLLIASNFINSLEIEEKVHLKENILKNEKEISANHLNQISNCLDYELESTNKEINKNLKNKVYQLDNAISNILSKNPGFTKEHKEELIIDYILLASDNISKLDYFIYNKSTNISLINEGNVESVNLSNKKDANGIILVNHFNSKLKNNKEAYTSSAYVNKDNKKANNIVFIKYIKELNIVIGSSISHHDVLEGKKKKILERLSKKRYSQNGYFWVMNTNEKLLMLPNKSNELTSNKSLKDIVGKTLKSKVGVFIEHIDKEVESNIEYQNISYAKYIKHWDWVIITDIYVKDIGVLFVEAKEKIHKKTISIYKNIFIVFMILLIVSIYISTKLSKITKLEFLKYSKLLEHENLTLEQKVKERTKELDNINKTLEEKIEIQIEKNRFNELKLLDKSKFSQISDMLENIAHQWRHPLSVISVISSGLLLKFELDMLNKKDAIRDLESLSENTLYLSNTIENFKSYVNQEQENKSTNLYELINKSLYILEGNFKSNNIILNIDIHAIKEININTNSTELSQVLLNILNNAKESLVNNNEKNNRNIYIDARYNDNLIKLEIKDNGGGIEDETIDKIFDPYFTTKHKSIGTGIGLYQVKKIIQESLKGDISIENWNKGVIVKIMLHTDN